MHTDLYDAFVPSLAAALREVRLGAALDFSVDMGSLASADQLAKVSEHVDDAVAKGAEVLAGGRACPDLGPYFYEPTLLAGVTDEMALCRDETFGPVAAVYRCDSLDEMVQRANDTEYGLNASVWTRDARLGREVATRLQSGTVNINEAYAAAWARRVRRWAASRSRGWAAATAPRASSNTPRRRPSPSSACCPSTRRGP